ncbi:hypothetical protein [uncultured Dysgonomonas sp.]|uniref:Uncharacterized protein n=1 Tax=uncultured Dysgonomonas sp. TaxID=206096 RepID=A0A212IXB1_9BACT|nr:hypothetical protein [uncultured Dysgonomonas sp.]SBV91819.1 conserved hypothetical protein [uncultured Dysgonomonas sp.]
MTQIFDVPIGRIRRKKGYLKNKTLVGVRFGRLVVLSKYKDSKYSGSIRWTCQCDCGKEIQINTGNLIYNKTKSCGCLVLDFAENLNKSHGKSKTSIFNIWVSMRARCYNTNGRYYSDYGGRGINVCDRWLESFENFYEDMGDRPSSKHSLDRIDVNGNYEPANCRWATKLEQANNTRNTVFLTHNGITKPISDWARSLGLNKQTIRSRIKQGETDMDKILSTRLRKNQFDF